MILAASFFFWPLEAIHTDIFPTYRYARTQFPEIKIDVKLSQNQKAEGRNNSSLRFARNGPGGIRTPDTVVRSHVL